MDDGFLPSRAMNQRPLLGTRLYNQIVYPMVAASVIVGLVAAAVAVLFLDDLTGRWVSEVAHSSTGGLALQFTKYCDRMNREASLVVDGGEMRTAIDSGDVAAVRQKVATDNAVLGFDTTMVLDPLDRVVAVSGAPGVELGSRPFGDVPSIEPGTSRGVFAPVQGTLTLSLFRPITATERGYTFVVSRVVDDRLLGELSVMSDGAFALYGDDRSLQAVTMGSQRVEATKDALRTAFNGSGEVTSLLERSDREKLASGQLRANGEKYQVWVTRITLPGANGPNPAPTSLEP